MPGYKWIKVVGSGANGLGVIVAEMEIIGSFGGVLSVGGTAFGSTPVHPNYPPSKLFDGVISGNFGSMFYSEIQPAWFGYHRDEPMDAVAIRLSTTAPADGYIPYRLENGVVMGSNNSYDGVDGSWEELAKGVNMADTYSTWTTHVLKRPTTVPAPVVLGLLPTTPTRGFR